MSADVDDGASEVVSLLRAILGHDGVIEDGDVLVAYQRDQAGFVSAGTPLAAVFPRSTAEVAAVVKLAHQRRIPLVPRGAGSGLAGGANAVDGCLVLVLTRMNAILAIDSVEHSARVQPGVINADLSRRVREEGLWYPPDPASWEFSTIGGNLATNAGGLCCVKYGVTRDWVQNLEVVLGDGRTVTVGRQTVKGVAGYDLVGLFVGSEGTLGIITEATLRLRPIPPARTTIVATFATLGAASEAIASVLAVSSPALLEIIDATTIAAIERWKRMGLDTDAAALLLVQSDLPGELVAAEATRIERACSDAGADLVVSSTDPEEAEMLLAARRFAFPALEQLGDTLLDDIAVPRGRLTAMIEAVGDIASRYGLTIGTFGHAGDGNLHPTIVYDRADPAQVERAAAAFDDIVQAALSLGGTVTGEHGVGLLKRDHLVQELGPVGVSLQRSIKAALDPHHILNPGKVFEGQDSP
ncbi:FAD-binding oxidoreductase [Egicoccus sp. AB-alg6-2]|uniref:FAD-binding oxidoreductase n=1 Tax=Egicoccus sp. AB-alg6-2 TaxID=3242692 RepID=UPI00359D6BC7